ncbi:MAG: NAD(P)H-dependent oxidoreductase subunit E [Nakamurella sp.]
MSKISPPQQYPDPNQSMVAGATASGGVTTAFWGGGGRPTLEHRTDVPQYVVTDELFDDDFRAKAAEIVSRYPSTRSAVMPLLHLAQSVEGFVSKNGIAFIARLLDMREAEVSGVSTFYNMYKREPVGEHIVAVCTNAMCAMLGGDKIYQALRNELGVDHEQTAGEPGTPGSVTLEHVECLACCDHGPVMTVNYEIFDNQTPESAVELVRALRRGERPHPTRGAALTDFKTVELELAGFMDTLDDEVDSPSATPETLRGVQLAADRGWTAPAMPNTPPAVPPVPEKK